MPTVSRYEEFADKLLSYRERQSDLIAFLAELKTEGVKVTPLDDKDETGRQFQLTEIDPFTFFGCFNRGVLDATRTSILEAIKSRFGVAAPAPRSFLGIPILNNQKSWFFSYSGKRKPSDVPRLWTVFAEALGPVR